MTTRRPLFVTVVASLYVLVGVVGFAYHVTDLGSEPALRAAMVLAVRLLAVVIGVAMLRGVWWARPAALAWVAHHVVLGALHSWRDASMHLLLLTLFTFVLLRRAAADYFRHAARARRPGAASIAAAVALSAPLPSVGGVQSAPPPPELQALAATARLEGTLTAWCRAEFIPRETGAFAAAVSGKADGGQYVALERDGRFTVLAAFQGDGDLTCYTRDEARRLSSSIRRSETIQGAVRPRWNSTVVCGFVDNTSAFCWQYSTALRRFVEVGRWTT